MVQLLYLLNVQIMTCNGRTSHESRVFLLWCHAKEQILVFEQYLALLNIFECSICKEYKVEEKPSLVDESSYTCGTWKTKNDPEFFIPNNLHPV